MTELGLSYANGGLDRGGASRKDATWMAAQLGDPQAGIVPVWRNRNLVSGTGTNGEAPRAVIAGRPLPASWVEAAAEIIFLGRRADRPIFALDVSVVEEDDALDSVEEGAFADLRQVGPLMAAGEASLMAYARGMVYWHRHNRHCGRCGKPTESREGGHVRVCRDPDCARPGFPRTDPAVIMVVERPDPAGGTPLARKIHEEVPPMPHNPL